MTAVFAATLVVLIATVGFGLGYCAYQFGRVAGLRQANLVTEEVWQSTREITRRQCKRCLKDCAECSCVEDVISKGKGV